MQNTIATAFGSAILGAVGLFTGVGSIEVYQSLTSQPDRRLEISGLDYRDGMFVQSSQVHGVDGLPARWTAKIVRGNNLLCSGGDDSAYSNGTLHMTPDQWTGDDCPSLQAGDRAIASWEWRDESGFVYTITREIIIEEGITHEN